MTETLNYKLEKYDAGSPANLLDQYNSSMDKVDTALKQINDKAEQAGHAQIEGHIDKHALTRTGQRPPPAEMRIKAGDGHHQVSREQPVDLLVGKRERPAGRQRVRLEVVPYSACRDADAVEVLNVADALISA